MGQLVLGQMHPVYAAFTAVPRRAGWFGESRTALAAVLADATLAASAARTSLGIA